MQHLFEKEKQLKELNNEAKILKAELDVYDFLKSLKHDWGEGDERVVSDFRLSEWVRERNLSTTKWQYLREELIQSYQHTTMTDGQIPHFIKNLDLLISKYFRLLGFQKWVIK